MSSLVVTVFCVLSVLSGASAAESEPRVCIVGAGFSGLAAATTLQNKYGFSDVTVFEALERVGGRAYSVALGRGYVNMGASYFHAKATPVYELAEAHGFVLSKKEQKRWLQSGELLLKEGGEPIHKKLHNTLRRAMTGNAALKRLASSEFEGQSWETAANTLFDEWADKYGRLWVKKNPEIYNIECMLKMAEIWMDGWYGCRNWDELSLDAIDLEEEFPAYIDLHIGGDGYQALADVLAQQAPDTAFEFGKKIINIDYSSGKVVLTDEGESQHDCDHVITTTSIGFLKANYETYFTPALADSYVDAMDAIGSGLGIEKVHALYTEPVWTDETILLQSFLFNDTSPATAEDLSHLFIDGASLVEGLPEAITYWVIGEDIDLIYDATDEQLIDTLQAVLMQFFPNKNPDSLRPLQIARTKWGRDPLFLGTWSYPIHGYDSAVTGYTTFGNNPIYDQAKPIIQFAGEATDIVGGYATVHGAYWSGEREADRLAAYYGRG